MQLTQEQAEKLKTLKTEKEIMAFFESENIKLSPEDLETISGGGFFDVITDAIKKSLETAIDGIF